MNGKLFFPILCLTLAALACNLPMVVTPGPPPLPATDTSPSPATASLPPTSPPTASAPATSVPGGLSLNMLRNATYTTPAFGHTIALQNGSYTEGSGPSLFSVQMLDVYAFGDLNGDGRDDAAVLLSENGGGSGAFISLIAVTNQDGQPHQAGQILLGDRVQVSKAVISSGVIHLTMLVQGPNDPMCCPSLAETQNYWLLGNSLRLMGLTSTQGGIERTITINSPGDWADVTDPFTIIGSVAVSPFENTLASRVVLLNGTVVNQSPLPVSSSGAGSPGTFTQTLNLESAGIKGYVILQYEDLSPANGSILALQAVVVNLH